jgi:hypothetical protein
VFLRPRHRQSPFGCHRHPGQLNEVGSTPATSSEQSRNVGLLAALAEGSTGEASGIASPADPAITRRPRIGFMAGRVGPTGTRLALITSPPSRSSWKSRST